MTLEFPSPMLPAADRAHVFVNYLDFFRETLIEKVSALGEKELHDSRLPSGWTPLELLKHLRWVELRWIEWGFEGKTVPEPWGDRRDDRWHVAPGETLATLVGDLREQGRHTTAVLTGTDLAAIGRPGPRWDGAAPPPLERICLHLVQEYARHVGHIDIVAELAGGPTGE